MLKEKHLPYLKLRMTQDFKETRILKMIHYSKCWFSHNWIYQNLKRVWMDGWMDEKAFGQFLIDTIPYRRGEALIEREAFLELFCWFISFLHI